jgi:hypothetical protein
MKLGNLCLLSKGLVIFAILALGLCSPRLASAAETAVVRVSAPSQPVRAGEQFIVNIDVEPNNAIAGVQLDLNFDSLLVSVAGVTEGNLLRQGGASTFFNPGNGNAKGVYGAIITPGETVSTPGTFATVRMTAGANAGTCPLTLSNVVVGDINGNPLPVSLVNGQVTIEVNQPPVLSPIGPKTVDAGEALVFTISATDPNGDALTYSASNLPSGASFNRGSRTFSWTPGYDQAGVYPNVRFQVSDGTLTDSEEITITVNHVNRPPVLSPIGPKTIDEGEPLVFTISATDPNGDALTYSAFNLPDGAIFDPGSGTFSWTPSYDQAGVYPNVRFQVSDGTFTDYEQITITVNNVDGPPVLSPIGSKTVDEGETLVFTISATDPNGDALTYSAFNLPDGASFDPGSGTFSWTPGYDQAGVYRNVRFQVSDGTFTDSEEITITVTHVNRPPVLSPIGPKTVDEGEALVFTISAVDLDADALTYSAFNLPDGAVFDPGSGTFSWTPGYVQAGVYPNVRFQVSDGTFTDSEEITITVNHVNRPPVLSPIGSKTVDEGEALVFIISATDPNGDALTYSASNLPDGAIFDSGSGTFSWTPGYGQAGVYPNVRFQVSDGTFTDSEEITITVNHVNRPPVLSLIVAVDEGQPLVFTISGIDLDGGALTYSASNLPDGASFDPGSRTFSWTPGYDQAGVYPNVRFQVSDGTSTVSQEITITVNDVNQPPLLNAIGPKTVDEGKLLAFIISANDPEGDTLIYSAHNLPDGASFDPESQTFSWTPGYDQAGVYPNVRLEVSDGTSTVSEEITIMVNHIDIDGLEPSSPTDDDNTTRQSTLPTSHILAPLLLLTLPAIVVEAYLARALIRIRRNRHTGGLL